MIKIINQY